MDTNDVDDYDSEGVTQASSNQRYTGNNVCLIAFIYFGLFRSPKTPASSPSGTLGKDGKKKPFFKKQDAFTVYDVVPSMRPVVICGPALKGYEVSK